MARKLSRDAGLAYQGNAATISVAAEDKAIALIQFFDYIFSEEGQLLFSFGVEGVHFDYVDGEPRLRPEYTTDFKHVIARQGMIISPLLMSGQGTLMCRCLPMAQLSRRWILWPAVYHRCGKERGIRYCCAAHFHHGCIQ